MTKPMTKAQKKAAYEAWYLAEIDKGLEDIEAGHVVSSEEADAEMKALMAELREKHGQNIAMTEPMTQAEKQQAYDAWFIAEVEKGIADCDAGNILSDEDAECELEAFMAKLSVDYGKKAA